MNKKKLLISTEFFRPGIKAGGLIEAALNLSRGLSSFFDIYILTSNRDLNNEESYAELIYNTWIDYDENIKIYYLDKSILNFYQIYKEISLIKPDVVFLNGFFSIRFNILPVILKYLRLYKKELVLSPRGMLKETALKFKRSKKYLYLNIFRFFKLQNIVKFHTTDNTESIDTRNLFGQHISLYQIFDMLVMGRPTLSIPNKEVGFLKCLFVGRIHPIKNLTFLINCFNLVNKDAKIEFTIIGPIEDENYWLECQSMIKTNKKNVKFIYLGHIPNKEILNHIEQNHLICNPSLGENFGYTIVESLMLSRPVLISNKTPWNNLFISNAGWDIDLEKPEDFVIALNQATLWEHKKFEIFCLGAKAYINEAFVLDQIKTQYIEMFNSEI